MGGTTPLPGPDVEAGSYGRFRCTAGARLAEASAAGPSTVQRAPPGHVAAAKPVLAGPQSAAEGAAAIGQPATLDGPAQVVPWDAGQAPVGGKRRSNMLGALLAVAAAKRARKNKPAAADALSPAIRLVVSHGVRGRQRCSRRRSSTACRPMHCRNCLRRRCAQRSCSCRLAMQWPGPGAALPR